MPSAHPSLSFSGDGWRELLLELRADTRAESAHLFALTGAGCSAQLPLLSRLSASRATSLLSLCHLQTSCVSELPKRKELLPAPLGARRNSGEQSESQHTAADVHHHARNPENAIRGDVDRLIATGRE